MKERKKRKRKKRKRKERKESRERKTGEDKETSKKKTRKERKAEEKEQGRALYILTPDRLPPAENTGTTLVCIAVPKLCYDFDFTPMIA